MNVLWLRPSTGEHVSLRRERIADHLSEMGVDITLCDSSGLDALSAIKLGITGDYDVIIGNVRIGLYLGYPLARLRRLPFVGDVSDHISDIDDLPKPIYEFFSKYEWWILTRSDVCFVVESKTYNEAVKRGIDPILVRNAVDYGKFADPDEEIITESERILKKKGVDVESPIAIYIGGMVPEYHLTELGNTAPLTSEWEFVFIGEEKGANISEIVSGVDNAHYIGAVEYDLIPGFLSHASCGLCLTDKEQPLKLMEYGAAGLPTIGYDGKLRENFTEEELIFVDSNPTKISEELEQLYFDEEYRQKYAQELRRKVKNHSWESIAEIYYEKLDNIDKDEDIS